MKSHFAKSKVHLAVAVLVSTLFSGQAAYGQAAAPVPPAVFTLPPPVFVPPTLVPITPPPAEPGPTPRPADHVLLPMPVHPGPALAATSGSIDGLRGDLQSLRGDLQSTERRVSAGVAMALAMSQPVSIAPGDTSAFTAAAGNFNGQSALAIGVHHTPIPGLLYSAGIGITTGSSSPAVRVGFSLSF